MSLVWVALQSTPDGDELVNRDTLLRTRRSATSATTRGWRSPSCRLTGPVRGYAGLYLSVTGYQARIVEGGAPELLKELNPVLGDPDSEFPPDGAPPGFLTRIRIEKIGGIGPLGETDIKKKRDKKKV